MRNKKLKGPRIFGFILLGAGALALFSWIVMLLWNSVLVAAISSAHIINFWQAAGLLILSKILFGGFKKSHHHEWKNKMLEKFNSMSDEEKQKFKEEWKSRCCIYKNKSEQSAGAE